MSRFCAFSYFMSTEYEESRLSTGKLHVGVVDDRVFDPRTGVHYVLCLVDEWGVGMTKYENLPKLDIITSSRIDLIERPLESILRGPVKPLAYRC